MNVSFTGFWNADLSARRFLGSEERIVFTCRTNGERNRNFLNGKAVRENARWEGDEPVVETWLQFGARAMHFCDRWFAVSRSSDAIDKTSRRRFRRAATVLSRGL